MSIAARKTLKNCKTFILRFILILSWGAVTLATFCHFFLINTAALYEAVKPSSFLLLN